MSTLRGRVRPTALVVLTGTWLLLWGHLSLFLVLTGLAVAVLTTLVFPLPSVDLHGRFRPLGALRLLRIQAVDL
ncbi:MAG: Na+/H+ antiporter subunit, partial [Friedmanniella sp.]|nr:Na+/H+ antiporter subunit [Friedmanniella sp.]